jgi:membrane fusion protein
VFFAAMAVLVILLLIFGSYTKKERVQGAIQARDGVAQVVPMEAGLMQRVLVQDGQHVKAGQPLVALTHDRQTDAGSTHALLSTQPARAAPAGAGADRGPATGQTGRPWPRLDQRIAQGQRNADSVAQEIQLQSQQVASSRKLLGAAANPCWPSASSPSCSTSSSTRPCWTRRRACTPWSASAAPPWPMWPRRAKTARG